MLVEEETNYRLAARRVSASVALQTSCQVRTARTIGLYAQDHSNNFLLPLCFLIETLAHPNTVLPFRYSNGTSRTPVSSLIDCISILVAGGARSYARSEAAVLFGAQGISRVD